MKSVALHNLGCKVNAYEMDVMRQMLQENGFLIVPFVQKADIYIINTCTVTNIADRKSRQMLHRARKQNPDAVIVAVGCYVQHEAENRAEQKAGRAGLQPEDLGADIIIGNNRKGQIVRILEEYFAQHEARDTVIDIAHTDEYEELVLTKPQEHVRAFLKIQDGCNQFCTYCAIPYARGRVRSRKIESVLMEARALAEAGCKELVLTGIHLSSYGLDFLGVRSADYRDAAKAGFLAKLIERLAAIPGVCRIRLGSLEPQIVTEAFAGRLAACDKLCPHFHLSLQSGCDTVLKRMNRHYDTERFAQSVQILRSAFAHAAVTTDVIVGFPGETEAEFAATKAYAERIGFYEMHVFKYSKRAGTPAALMENQVPDNVKAERSEELIAVAGRLSDAYRAQYIGQPMEILTEEHRRIGGVRYLVGHTKDYVLAAVPEGAAEPNQIVRGIGKEQVADGDLRVILL
ncbi:MAG: tRNA (N(6)-L-threonylcarbamoyladenosine(37)-C(2))-methylthiotransferase MtaB [Clostridium sp.]|nr:tRNA (N(6)-L-threonylcarbamoyladenosine(37)-C(2))-methylthiotransferase MtaB [Clostridium sp.]